MLLSIYEEVIGFMWIRSLILGSWRDARSSNCVLSAQVTSTARCCWLAPTPSLSTTQWNTSTSLMPSSGFPSPLWGYPDVSRPLKMKSEVPLFSQEICQCCYHSSLPALTVCACAQLEPGDGHRGGIRFLHWPDLASQVMGWTTVQTVAPYRTCAPDPSQASLPFSGCALAPQCRSHSDGPKTEHRIWGLMFPRDTAAPILSGQLGAQGRRATAPQEQGRASS